MVGRVPLIQVNNARAIGHGASLEMSISPIQFFNEADQRTRSSIAPHPGTTGVRAVNLHPLLQSLLASYALAASAGGGQHD